MSGAASGTADDPTSAALSPAHEADVTLRDGATARVRVVRPEDEPALCEFLRGLSARSLRMRFCGAVGDDGLRREARRQAHVADGLGLVAVAGPGERIVGHAEYTGVRGDRAEVSFAIGDAFQGRGLGTILVGQLAQAASASGIRTLEAIVHPGNRQMLTVFRESGFPVQVHAAPGEIRVEFPTELTDDALERFEEREWTAAVNAMGAFFRPRSVAVIGASRRRGTIAGEVLHNLLSYGFAGPVLPVNPHAPVVQSVIAYPSVEDVPGPVDLAVLVVPCRQVVEAAEACGRKGVRALVVISAGFAETGPEGRARQDALVRVCRAAGMRLIGPNCMGIVNTDPAVRLDATFAPVVPPAGRVAFMSQSGALGLAVMDYAGALGLGLSTFVSVGNKADVSGNDLIRYWARDPHTDVILLYLESYGNPRKFSRVARRVAREKPIVAVKGGRSPAGARATGSHTGALIAASDVTVDALFRYAGVIRTDTLSEMFDVASLLASQPLPTGNRVAILTNAGGPGILCADACAAEGLETPPLGAATQAALRALLPPEASVQNPVDMIASATADQYREAIRVVGADPEVDALVVIFIPPLVTRAEDVARAIVDGARALRTAPDGVSPNGASPDGAAGGVAGGAKPVLTVFMQSRGVPEELRGADVHLPSYAFPEDAAIALARVARYGAWRARTPAPPARFPEARRDEATALVAAALGRGAGWLAPDEAWTLLACYGLPVLEQRLATTPEEAAEAAARLGGTVALKAVAPGLVHKSDAGGVRLSLEPHQVSAAASEMETRLRERGHAVGGFLLQRMAPGGVEMIVGVAHDPQFGPVVACGAGGVLVELLKDVSVRLAPLSRADAEEMLRELRTYPLLTGYRGGPPRDVPALVDAILRVGALVEELPQVAELDLNPLLVHRNGVTIVDARVRVAPAEPPPLPGTRP
jgi:acetyl coenzyme A synthetase (ADP forming)-like protein